MKNTEVMIDPKKLAYASREKTGGYKLTTLKDPIILSQKQFYTLLSLLVFIALAITFISIYQTVLLGSVGNQIIERILESSSVLMPL
jgi:hypothetical protein